MLPALLSQYPFGDDCAKTLCPVVCVSCCPYFLLPVFLMLLLPDIPLSQLEAKNSDDIHLLRERISHLKHQIAGIAQPPGKMLITAIFSIIAK